MNSNEFSPFFSESEDLGRGFFDGQDAPDQVTR